MAVLAAPETVLDDHPPASPADSDMTVVAALPQEAPSISGPGYSRAVFSTNFGERPPRQVPGPPYPPVVVRGYEKVKAVADAAIHWRAKYPRQTLAILPGCGWCISDFWDPLDIHMDTPGHYEAVLKYISEQNVLWARDYAVRWSKEHPEQVCSTVGLTNMADICNPHDPEDVVSKIFVYGERHVCPTAFLWQAAQTMRTTMLEIRAEQRLAKVEGGDGLKAPPAEQKLSAPMKHDTKASTIEPPIIDGSSAQADGAMLKATSKTNRKIRRSRPQRLTAFAEPSHAVAHVVPAPIEPPTGLHNPHIVPQATKRAPSYGPSRPGAHHGQPTGGVPGGMPPFAMGSPSMSVPPLYVPKGGQFHVVPSHHMSSGAYSENRSRAISGAYAPRPTSGTMSNTHSPNLKYGAMAMGQPVMGPQHPMQYGPISPSSYPAQPYYPGMAPPGMAPPLGVHMPGQNMPPGLVGVAARGPSMGDRTNDAYYSSNMPPYNVGMQQHGSRRSSFYGNNSGSLYDPYNGTKPAFSDHTATRKPSRGTHMGDSSRPRKTSAADNRPRTSSHGLDRADAGPGNGDRYSHYGSKPRMTDIPEKVNDKVRGCGEKWIGPENTDVNELFVADLFDDTDPEEVMGMFTYMIGITPSKAVVRQTQFGHRSHAFVS